MLLHCLFLHLYSGRDGDELWDLACDIAVENIIEGLKVPRLSDGKNREFLQKLDEKGGFFPFTEKADPELIKEELGLTKNAFKRAVGRLLKQRKIEISDGKIIKK